MKAYLEWCVRARQDARETGTYRNIMRGVCRDTDEKSWVCTSNRRVRPTHVLWPTYNEARKWTGMRGEYVTVRQSDMCRHHRCHILAYPHLSDLRWQKLTHWEVRRRALPVQNSPKCGSYPLLFTLQSHRTRTMNGGHVLVLYIL